MSEFEEQYLDVLQNIETALVTVIRDQPTVLDYDVRAAVEALIREYQAVGRNRAAPAIKRNQLTEVLYSAAKVMCEYRLGHIPLNGITKKRFTDAQLIMSPITVDEIVACLKRIRKSIDMWTRERGRRGYCDFIDDMML